VGLPGFPWLIFTRISYSFADQHCILFGGFGMIYLASATSAAHFYGHMLNSALDGRNNNRENAKAESKATTTGHWHTNQNNAHSA